MAKNPDIIKQATRKIYEQINDIRIKKNISWAEIIYQLNVFGYNLNRNTPTDWKNGKSSSFLHYLGEISSILDVPVEEIGNVDVKQPSLPVDDINFAFGDDLLFALWGEVRDLTDEEKQDILDFVKFTKSKRK